jgi:hypothetical protein
VRPVSELVVEESAWPEIEACVGSSPYPIEVLPAEPDRAALCLRAAQVTTGSWLGAVIYHSGGLLVDHGWLRVFGSGSAARGLADIRTVNEGDQIGVVVAEDVLGGRFAWGRPSADAPPVVHYFGPDDPCWQDLGLGYGAWLQAMLAGAMSEFYASLRWPGWEAEVTGCPLDQGIHTWPPPWTREGRDLGAVSRRAVPIAELVGAHQEAGRQLNGDAVGDQSVA